MRKPYRVEDTVEAVSHISRICEAAVLVRYQGIVLAEIYFLAQASYHFYCRIIERNVTLTRLALQLADLDFKLGYIFQPISYMNFFHTSLQVYDAIFKVNVAVDDSAPGV